MRYLVIAASLFFLCLSISNSTFAFSARLDLATLTKLATLHDEDGKIYVLERIEEKSTAAMRPYLMQVRDQNGFVVARTIGAGPFFCPSLDWCWNLSYYPKRFNAGFIRYKSISHEIAKDKLGYTIPKNERSAFFDYLSNPETTEFTSKNNLYPRGIRATNSTEFMTLFLDRKENKARTFGAYYEYPYFLPVLVLLSLFFILAHEPFVYLYSIALALYHIPFVYVCKKCVFANKNFYILNKWIVRIVLAFFCLILFLPHFMYLISYPLFLMCSGRFEFSILLYWLVFVFSLFLIKKSKKILLEKLTKK